MEKIIKQYITAHKLQSIDTNAVGVTTALCHVQFDDNTQYKVSIAVISQDMEPVLPPQNFDIAYITTPNGTYAKDLKNNTIILEEPQDRADFNKLAPPDHYIELTKDEHFPAQAPANCYKFTQYTKDSTDEDAEYVTGFAFELKPNEYIDFSI